MNRVQFQAGLSMAEFMDRYGSDGQCEAALIEARWPAGFACPACGGGQSRSFRRERRRYYQCSACRHQCSVISGTIFEATKLPLTRWFLAMHLLTQSKNNVAALELKRHLGVCYKTAWLLKHKLMEVMRVREDSRQLDGRVEIDDAYLGGERAGGKAGRGSENKVPFIAAVQTTPTGQPQFVCMRQQPFTSAAVAVFATRSIPSWATSSVPWAAPTTPSTLPSTRIATSPKPNIDSTVASICAPSWRACCALLVSQHPPLLRPFGWLS